MKAGQITHSGTHSDDQLVSLCGGSYSHLGGRVALGGSIWDGGAEKRRFRRVGLRWGLEGVGG